MILIKIGGGKDIHIPHIAQDISEIIKTEQVIVVHGANATRDDIMKRMGLKSKTIVSPSGISSVYTDQQAIDVFLMSYAGLVNKRIVESFQRYGINAVGLSGIDGKLWQAKRKKHIYAHIDGKTKLISDSYTGRVESVNGDLVSLICSNGYVPVICPPALSDQNEIVNTDNDMAIAVMAKTLPIQKVVSLFEAPGFLRDHTDETTVIPSITKGEIEGYMEHAVGRMKKKVMGAIKTLESNVEAIHWGDGRVERPISRLLEGEGTVIRA